MMNLFPRVAIFILLCITGSVSCAAAQDLRPNDQALFERRVEQLIKVRNRRPLGGGLWSAEQGIEIKKGFYVYLKQLSESTTVDNWACKLSRWAGTSMIDLAQLDNVYSYYPSRKDRILVICESVSVMYLLLLPRTVEVVGFLRTLRDFDVIIFDGTILSQDNESAREGFIPHSIVIDGSIVEANN